MADISLVNNANPIKNGTLVLYCTKTGFYKVENTYVNNLPSISAIEDKYDDRFDDLSYYTLGQNTLIGA